MRKILLSLTAALCACFAYAQNMQVSGIVTDADSNEPMVGVTVAVEGTTDGTVTDMDGAYSISVPSNAKLTFQFCLFIDNQPSKRTMISYLEIITYS